MKASIKRMKAAIAKARAKNGERPATKAKACCDSGWPDVHTSTCPVYRANKKGGK